MTRNWIDGRNNARALVWRSRMRVRRMKISISQIELVWAAVALLGMLVLTLQYQLIAIWRLQYKLIAISRLQYQLIAIRRKPIVQNKSNFMLGAIN